MPGKKLNRFYQFRSGSRQRQAFDRVFGSEWGLMDTIGDGSCFIHAIARALIPKYDTFDRNSQQMAGHRLRRSLIGQLNEQMYLNTVDRIQKKRTKLGLGTPRPLPYRTFKQKFLNTREWFELYMISAVCHHFNLNIIFWDSTENSFHYGVDELASHFYNYPTIFVHWQNKSHFELIVRRTNGHLQRQFHYDHDGPLLQRIIRHYAQ